MRIEPAARCSAAVIGWLAAASIEGGVGGVAQETMHRPPRLRPKTEAMGMQPGGVTIWTPSPQSSGNRTHGPTMSANYLE